MQNGTWNLSAALTGISQIPGQSSGRLLTSTVELSFWGGVDSSTSEVIDRHHPLSGQHLQGTILAIPGGRGSCSGSGVILELILNGKGPRALVFARREDVLTLGVLVAKEVFGKSIPVIILGTDDFKRLPNARYASVDGDQVRIIDDQAGLPLRSYSEKSTPSIFASNIELSDFDKDCLNSKHGAAAQIAMRIILQMAELQGVKTLIYVSQVHIDGCVYTGQASLSFAQRLRDQDGKVLVPTTMNSISIDQRRWRLQGVDYTFGSAADQLAKAYTDMGAKPTFTCAPYLLDSKPKPGDQVAWAESNAVVFANSVLGARTMKYPDFLDIAIALTGRALDGDMHSEKGRRAKLIVKVENFGESKELEESFWPLLGYCVGGMAGHRIPAVVGCDELKPTIDDLKNFGAAFATVASAPMFHMVGVTPEAPNLYVISPNAHDIQSTRLTLKHLVECRRKLNSADPIEPIDLLSLGSPHFSYDEFAKLTALIRGRTKHRHVEVVVTTSRHTYRAASDAGFILELERFGVKVVTDTCWCMMVEPVIPSSAKVIMTNSAKYAHYGPGLTGRRMRFGSLKECVKTACTGMHRANESS